MKRQRQNVQIISEIQGLEQRDLKLHEEALRNERRKKMERRDVTETKTEHLRTERDSRV